MKNILITTLGTSWQIVPELLSLTNPQQFDFFSGSKDAEDFRKKNSIQNVDECWIITTEGTKDKEKLSAWAEKWKFVLKIFICSGVDSFSTEKDILKMRSFIYRAVLHGASLTGRNNGKLYLSLSGGRKTMSADMQDAGNLFGCDLMLHIIDRNLSKTVSDAMKSDSFLENTKGNYAAYFLPILVSGKTDPSPVISAGRETVIPEKYPFPADISKSVCIDCSVVEDGSLNEEIQKRKEESSRLYINFYDREISQSESVRSGIFRKMYFLRPEILRNLKDYRLGVHPEKDLEIIRALPKAELHSHLGGVLEPAEILQVTGEEKDPEVFGEEIYGRKYLHREEFHAVGIDAYQKLGDRQGSALLQTKEAVKKTIYIYAEKLKKDNVKYLELRCSPQKYTKRGLTTEDVVNCIMDSLGRYSENFDYRLIWIMPRESRTGRCVKEEIKRSLDTITELLKTNERFRDKLVGIDLAGNEGAASPADLRESFMPVLEQCIHVTIHAGETENVDSIWQAVYHLSADRIGHGLHLLDKPELMNRFIDKNIGIEMCPSSNDQIVGYSKPEEPEYPLLEYMKKGLKVTINTDDCGISLTNLSREFIKASQLCPGLTLWDCIVLIRNSISVAFCDSETKRRLMQSFESEIIDICEKYLKDENMLH